MMASEAGTVSNSGAPDGLHDAANSAGSKARIPATTAMTIGINPTTRATAASQEAVLAPMI